MEYAQSEDGGKKKVQKVGMAPVQSDGIEYEFSVVLDVAMNHECEVSKDRTHLFDKTPIFTITEETGELLVNWRSGGKERPAAPPARSFSQTPPPQEFPPDDNQSHPSDDLDAFLGGPGSYTPMSPQETAGTYVIGFGAHKGKMLMDVDEKILREYCNWLMAESNRTGKPIQQGGLVDTMLAQAAIFLGVE